MEEKEAEVMDVLRNYTNLEKELEAKGQHMTPLMMASLLGTDAVHFPSHSLGVGSRISVFVPGENPPIEGRLGLC